jgi:hypothetical protein
MDDCSDLTWDTWCRAYHLTTECTFRTVHSVCFGKLFRGRAGKNTANYFFFFSEPVLSRCSITRSDLIQHKLVNCNRTSRATDWQSSFVSRRSRIETLRPGIATRFRGAFAKLRKPTPSFVMSVCLSVFVRPLGTTRFPLNGFSWNLIFEYFSKISIKFNFH